MKGSHEQSRSDQRRYYKNRDLKNGESLDGSGGNTLGQKKKAYKAKEK